MFTIFFILLIVVIVMSIVKKQNEDNQQVSKSINLGRIIVLVVMVVVLISSALIQIGPGHVGVPILFGSVQDNVLKSGLNIVNPLVEVEKQVYRQMV
jgi:hypothetical protein